MKRVVLALVATIIIASPVPVIAQESEDKSGIEMLEMVGYTVERAPGKDCLLTMTLDRQVFVEFYTET